MDTSMKLAWTEGVRMKVMRIHEHFPARSAEWGLAYIMTTVGAVIALDQGDLILTQLWAYLAMITGLLRLTALYINGSSRHTPKARMVCAAVSVMVWMHMAVLFLAAFEKLGVFPVVLAIIPWFIAGDIYASYSAGKDARVASEIKKALGNGDGSDSGTHSTRAD